MKHVLILIWLLSGSAMAAQTCLSTIQPTTPESSFTDNGDGTLTDSRLGLTWMRCSLGQVWQDDTCSGEPLALSWQQALQMAHGYQFGGKGGWRLPNVKELATITEGQCVRPAINQVLFPNTPADDFWSASPSMSDPQRAWVIAFYNSSNALKDKTLFVYARLVRTAD